ncbi:MAG: sodium-dependent transporter [Halieaceae bacterium]|jgi:neurotransmitter:Na+ symporter, NSS family|nr:sodium-dependent transporter [Halieaceae bacterium]
MADKGFYAHANWSSRLTFILAAVGSSVGLGNFWRFPFEAGRNGGGAFVLIYLICILLVAMPLLLAELGIGRRGKQSAVGSYRQVAVLSNRSPAWRFIGWLGMTAVFFTLAYYSVIAGWIVAYIPIIAMGKLIGASAGDIRQIFTNLLASPWTLTICHAVFMAVTTFIVARGIKGGIELAVKILMPAFFVMLLLVTIASGVIGDFAAGAKFLLTPDFSKINPRVILSATGQAFFSIGLTGALMVTYGAYVTSDISLPRAGLSIAFSDTLVAVIAGLAIFPIVYGFGLDASEGPGLLFVTLPVAFAQMGDSGLVFGLVFFLLALFAALTSSISVLEVATSWAEEQLGGQRAKVATILGFLAFLIGMFSVLGLNVWSDVHPLGVIKLFEGKDILNTFDTLLGKIMLPLSGFFVAIFAGWIAAKEIFSEELNFSDPRLFAAWRFLIRFVCPPAVLYILYQGF